MKALPWGADILERGWMDEEIFRDICICKPWAFSLPNPSFLQGLGQEPSPWYGLLGKPDLTKLPRCWLLLTALCYCGLFDTRAYGFITHLELHEAIKFYLSYLFMPHIAQKTQVALEYLLTNEDKEPFFPKSNMEPLWSHWITVVVSRMYILLRNLWG